VKIGHAWAQHILGDVEKCEEREPLEDQSRLGEVRQHDPVDRCSRDDRGIRSKKIGRNGPLAGRNRVRAGSVGSPGSYVVPPRFIGRGAHLHPI
jgi:hypothetical protein